jgi:hypothetical protein
VQSRYLPKCRDATAMAAMKAVKDAWDPLGILNPGKVFFDLPFDGVPPSPQAGARRRRMGVNEGALVLPGAAYLARLAAPRRRGDLEPADAGGEVGSVVGGLGVRVTLRYAKDPTPPRRIASLRWRSLGSLAATGPGEVLAEAAVGRDGEGRARSSRRACSGPSGARGRARRPPARALHRRSPTAGRPPA